MCKIAIIGAGISGLSIAYFLKRNNKITVYEGEGQPGGLIKCEDINGSLFHTCGGHVFNSKRKDVLEFFWAIFQQNRDFVKAERNSVVYMENIGEIPYPIENNIFHFGDTTQKNIISDWIHLSHETCFPDNFEDFLRGRFGETLYSIYFKPYNEKVWRQDLKSVPISWLEGKLPMPTVEEMIFNNVNKVKEKSFVHSTFWYEKNGGSQFIADTLAKDLNIRYSCPVECMVYDSKSDCWIINDEKYEKVVFCGNIKQMIHIVQGIDLSNYYDKIDALKFHGTTSVFCEIDKNPYSWIYQPSANHRSHRIICTGNFAKSNNSINIPKNRITATIEFTDEIAYDDICENLRKIPYNPTYICHKYNKYTYPIQDVDTRGIIKEIKNKLANKGMFFTGRFADWEYYNMDAAMGSAMDLCKTINK